MVGTYKFSESQLKNLETKYLLRLADYYEIPIHRDTEKGKLIKLILEKQKEYQEPIYTISDQLIGEQEMSVRIRRIKESQEK